MIHYKRVAQEAPVDMSVYFCCNNRLMTKHLLNSPEVSSGFDHMGCKRVAEGVRTDVFSYAGPGTKVLNNCKNHCPGEPSSSSV